MAPPHSFRKERETNGAPSAYIFDSLQESGHLLGGTTGAGVVTCLPAPPCIYFERLPAYSGM